MASLANVDGALVITRDLSVIGFGAKIAVGTGGAPPVCIRRLEPGTQEVVPTTLEDVGQMRHQAAIRFAAANKDAVALVISQDRHISVIHWDEERSSVAVIPNAEWSV
jgi:hypothetical protein